MKQASFQPENADTSVERIAAALAESGWGIFVNALPPELTGALARRARQLHHYQPAGVGRANANRLNRFVRRDRTAWVGGDDPSERAWLDWAEELRIHLNRSLMLGLSSFESHFAHYPPDAFYRRHLDAFRGSGLDNRVVSLVTYLNPDWSPSDAGELVLYDDQNAELGRFPPSSGTLLVYLSERFPHEVLPTQADRFSIAGWFKRRAWSRL